MHSHHTVFLIIGIGFTVGRAKQPSAADLYMLRWLRYFQTEPRAVTYCLAYK